jgi:hypothetical protein
MSASGRSLEVAITGGGMVFDEINGQSFKDFMCGSLADALTSIGMNHLASSVSTGWTSRTSTFK